MLMIGWSKDHRGWLHADFEEGPCQFNSLGLGSSAQSWYGENAVKEN